MSKFIAIGFLIIAISVISLATTIPFMFNIINENPKRNFKYWIYVKCIIMTIYSVLCILKSLPISIDL